MLLVTSHVHVFRTVFFLRVNVTRYVWLVLPDRRTDISGTVAKMSGYWSTCLEWTVNRWSYFLVYILPFSHAALFYTVTYFLSGNLEYQAINSRHYEWQSSREWINYLKHICHYIFVNSHLICWWRNISWQSAGLSFLKCAKLDCHK